MLPEEGKGLYLAGKRNSRKANMTVVSEQAWRDRDGDGGEGLGGIVRIWAFNE